MRTMNLNISQFSSRPMGHICCFLNICVHVQGWKEEGRYICHSQTHSFVTVYYDVGTSHTVLLWCGLVPDTPISVPAAGCA